MAAPRLIVLFGLAACGGGADPALPDAEPEDPRSEACQAQDDAIRTVIAEERTTPNAMVAVRNAECGTTVYVGGSPGGADQDSLYRIGSVTKTFVAGAILSLVEDGELGLDDPLADHVADVAQTDGVTVRMLLSHQSGIYNYTNDAAFFADLQRVWTPREIVDFATSHAPVNAPGAAYSYSNTNYVLLGMILEEVTGMDAVDVLHARSIDPAGLEHTKLDGAEPLGAEMATGFADDGTTAVTFAVHPSGPWTAGAMVASGADLVDWIYTYFGTDAVLADETRDLVVADPVGGYGLGSMFWASNGTTGVGRGHTGVINGFVTIAFYFPVVDGAIAVVVNQDGADPSALFRAAAAALYN